MTGGAGGAGVPRRGAGWSRRSQGGSLGPGILGPGARITMAKPPRDHSFAAQS